MSQAEDVAKQECVIAKLTTEPTCCSSSLRLTDFESQAAQQRDRLFFSQRAPNFLVLLDQMPHHLGLELHPVRHPGNRDSLFHFRPSDFDPTDKLFICRTA